MGEGGYTTFFHKAINGQSCKLKNSWSDGKIKTASCVHANFSHFYLGILSLRIFCLFGCPSIETQKSVYYCLVIPLWKCQYCLIWALNKSILFGSNSLELSVLSDMNSEKTFYRSFIWVNSLKMLVLLGVNSEKVCIIVCQ